MLATLASGPPETGAWVYERKLDGIRTLAYRERGGPVTLWSRNGLSLTDSFVVVASALADRGPSEFAVDGEVVAYAGSKTSFELLQQRNGRSVRLVYVVFDVPMLDGADLRTLPLLERKAALKDAFRWGGTLRFSAHRRGDPERLLAAACTAGWEGLIAKRTDATYQDRRSRDWLKLKCSMEQEFVVGGWSEPKGSRTGFGALLLGTYERGRLRFAGEVGTGFSQRTLLDLSRRLLALETERSPFDDLARTPKGVHWAKPELVAQVGFTEWTRDGKLRHARFLGLREDKAPRDVRREVAS